VRFEIDYLARHERYLPLIAEWQLAEFGHLNDIRLPLTAARKANLTGRVGPATSRHAVYRFRFAIGFASSRALSMKSCATGLSARSLRVRIPFGRWAIGSSTDKTLSAEPLVRNLSAEAGKTVIKRPVSNRLTRI